MVVLLLVVPLRWLSRSRFAWVLAALKRDFQALILSAVLATLPGTWSGLPEESSFGRCLSVVNATLHCTDSDNVSAYSNKFFSARSLRSSCIFFVLSCGGHVAVFGPVAASCRGFGISSILDQFGQTPFKHSFVASQGRA